jgi:O-antigen ligase
MDDRKNAKSERTHTLLNSSIFYLLLVVIGLAAIPYGTAEPWWQAAVECSIFGLAILWVIEGFLKRRWFVRQHRLLVPLLVLVAFTLVQMTLPLRRTASGDSGAAWNTISFSPYDSKMVALLLLSLICVTGLLLRYTDSRRRLITLVCVVIGIGLSSTIFGLVRKAFQSRRGFLLPALQPDDSTFARGVGFAQFINHNHFAFLAEMSLGLVLGLMLTRPIRFTRLALGLALAIPMWVAVVYSGSRGGLASIMGQVFFVALLVFVVRPGQQLLREGKEDERKPRMAPFLVTRAILIASFLVVMLMGIGWVGGERLASHLDSATEELGVKESDKYTRTYRSTVWPMTWQMIKDHPLSGVGFGAYWIAITRYHRGSGEMTPQQAHNDYLELLASGGVIAVAIGLWFFIVFFKELNIRLHQRDASLIAFSTGALASIFGVAIHSIFDFGLHITINSLLFVALMVIATVSVPKDRSVGDRTQS